MARSENYTFDPNRLPFFVAEDYMDSRGWDFARFAVEVAADEVFLMSSDSKIVYVNKSACKRLGYEEEELRGKFVWEWDPLFPKSAWTGFWAELISKKHLHFETQHKTQQGDIFPVEIHAHYFVDGDNEFILAFVNDLTEKKKLEEEKSALFRKEKELADLQLIRSKNELEEAQRLAKVGSWKLDHETNLLSWSPEIYRIFEIDPHGFKASYRSFLERVHPEDREMVDQVFQSCVETHQIYEIEHRLIMPDKRIKYVIEKGKTFYDELNMPLTSIGTIQDITQRKQLELETAETKQHYQMIFDNSPDAYLIMEVGDGKVTDLNQAAEAMLRGQREDILGMTPDQLSPPRQPGGRNSTEAAAEIIAHTLSSGHHHFEWLHRRFDGTNFWAEVNISLINIKQRQAFLVAWRDISERKQLERDIIDAKVMAEQAAAKATYQASHDALTGLVNRFSLNERLQQMLSTAKRSGKNVALLFIDMDRFKHINDSVGHQAGDAVIKQVAQRLKSIVKRDSDVLARIGGDEFIVVLNEVENSTVALTANHILNLVSEPYHYQKYELYSSGSIGIAMYPTDASDSAELIKNADIAMYEAKEKGRNKYKFFSESINKHVTEDIELEHALHVAIQNHELELHYHPQINSHNLKMIGLEALLRWKHPKKGFISPLRFIQIAERSGQILDLGEWVLNQACSDLATWREQGHTHINVAINISVIQLRSTTFTQELQSSLDKYDLPADAIEIEITESVAMDDPDNTIQTLNRIKALGCKITIDDFGTGYSSLAYLKNLPVDKLKLDRSFVRDIELDENDRAICEASISLSHSLGLSVVAEGVESVFQKDFLTSLGCDYLQGFLFSKPMPFDQVTFD